MRILNVVTLLALSFSASAQLAQHSATAASPGANTAIPSDGAFLRPYDSSTLSVIEGPVLLPFNRIITPAGTVMRFGSKELENHSLDAVLLPGGHVLAVEDRYGVAFVQSPDNKLLFRLDYKSGPYQRCMNTYSGIKTYSDSAGQVHVVWSTSDTKAKGNSYVLDAAWDGTKAEIESYYTIQAEDPAPLALPNDIAVTTEKGATYLYIVLNGNNSVIKVRWSDKTKIWELPTGMAPFGIARAGRKLYISNWAGPFPKDTLHNTAGIPYGHVYIDPRTGATALGTVTVIEESTGKVVREIRVGLHPNSLLASRDGKFIYVANGNSDNVSVIATATDKVVDSIPVHLPDVKKAFIGDTPDGLALSPAGTTLYVSAAMDNAVAVVPLSRKNSSKGTGTGRVRGFIPTEAYPAGLVSDGHFLYVSNLEGEGARATRKDGTYNSHQQEATFSVIPVPDATQLRSYTAQVLVNNFTFRQSLSQLRPRPGIRPVPVPERIGEPSVFKHVIYIIKENRTYDQVLGDMPEGNGQAALCMYGDTITPNQHRLARSFELLDNYYASGKCSAEGHQWTDAGMVTDYVEKNVRAWFRSYPHVQTDALVYDRNGFIWNNALDHGKTVRVFGEAAVVHVRGLQDWTSIYGLLAKGEPLSFYNVTTISRVAPILDTMYPGFDGPNISDQFRANAFIQVMNDCAAKPGDEWPQLMVLALPNDHTVGTRPGNPVPESMVADNDLALGRIIQAVTQSRFWDSTVIFVTEDDSQAGWDHVSAYRTTGFIISPYSRLGKTMHMNYNQVSMLRTIEQILGIPPMNAMDATARPMWECFTGSFDTSSYSFVPNRVPLDRLTPQATALTGKARKYAELSSDPQFDHIDGGDDDLLNHILWFAAMGDKPYPRTMVLPKKDRKDADD